MDSQRRGWGMRHLYHLCSAALIYIVFTASVAFSFEDHSEEIRQNYLYFGAGGGLSHHTGYFEDGSASVEQWPVSGFIFAGYAPNSIARLEIATTYLGQADIDWRPGERGRTRANAVSLTGLLVSPTILPDDAFSLPLIVAPTRFFLRGGVAYKWVRSVTPAAHGSNSGPVYVIGAGVEADVHRDAFARLEITYYSKLPSKSDVIHSQHTLVGVSFGYRF